MFRSLSLSVLFFAAPIAAQEQPRPAPAVEVPTFANPTCPIMGKKVSMPLFVDTELGRFYVCCKPCYKKILANVPAAHKTAYPVVQEVSNTVCPVSGEPIGEHAVSVTLQGYTFKVCCEGCVADARTHSQVTLVKLTRSRVADVGNDTCPVSGEPVAPNAFALVDGNLVRLASPKLVAALEADPRTMLAKAQAIQQKQKPKGKHEHTKKVPAAEAVPAKPEVGK